MIRRSMDERGAVDLSARGHAYHARALLGPDGKRILGVEEWRHPIHRMRVTRLDEDGNPTGPSTVHEVRGSITTHGRMDPCVEVDPARYEEHEITVRFIT